MKKVKKVQLECLQCKNTFEVHPYRKNSAKFCNRKCKDSYLIGKAPKIDNHGKIPWIKGRNHTVETINKIKSRYYPIGNMHHSWKGDNVGYFGLHDWIEKVAGKPKKCELCGTVTYPKYEWANKSRNYKRDVNDWIRLCIPCHRKADYYRTQL